MGAIKTMDDKQILMLPFYPHAATVAATPNQICSFTNKLSKTVFSCSSRRRRRSVAVELASISQNEWQNEKQLT